MKIKETNDEDSNLILYFVKYPEPGKVKTRLAKTLGDHKAAAVYRELAEKIFDVLHSLLKQNIEITVVFDPPDQERQIKQWLSVSGYYLAQKGNDLGERMRHAFEFGFQKGFKRVMAVGSDIVGLTPEIILQGFSALKDHEIVLGPALDGGYYSIGLNSLRPALFENIPWSTSKVLESTLAAVKKEKLSSYFLSELEDLDEVQA